MLHGRYTDHKRRTGGADKNLDQGRGPERSPHVRQGDGRDGALRPIRGGGLRGGGRVLRGDPELGEEVGPARAAPREEGPAGPLLRQAPRRRSSTPACYDVPSRCGGGGVGRAGQGGLRGGHDREHAAQGGVGRPKRGRLAPGFDLEQEKVRAGREIARGDRPAPPRDHRFLEDLEELL